MFRSGGRSIPSLQFIASCSGSSFQVRTKAVKLYKGSVPRKPKSKKPSSSPDLRSKGSTNPNKDESKSPTKKGKDPLQGMREANERERIEQENLRKSLSEAHSSPKPAKSAIAAEQEPNRPKLQSPEKAEASSNPFSVQSPSGVPSGRPIPPASIPMPKLQAPGRRKLVNFMIATIFFGGGAYLYWFSPTESTFTKDLSSYTKPAPENVQKAIELLRNFFGERVSTVEDDLEQFGGEGMMSVGSGGKPRAIVWPETTAEVEVILKVANDYGVPVIPYSGGTSLEGQCVPTTDAITVCLTKMSKIIAFRPYDMDITLQPGISWNDLNSFLKPYKLFFPVDPGQNASIGGMIATSASGTNAVGYGTMKDWVLNLTVVLPGGHVMKTSSRARKSSTGYDLTRLFVGSEGTLGIITEVTLKLAHLPEKEVVGTIAFETNTAAAHAMSKLFASGIEPTCLELLDTTCMSAVNNSLDKSIRSFPLKPHIFFKLSGSANVIRKHQEAFTSVLAEAGGKHLRIARNEKEGNQLWDVRKSLVYSLVEMFPGSDLIATDVCVPRSRLPVLIEQYKRDQERINGEITASAEADEARKLSSLIVGHIGDGNFHSAYKKGDIELKKKAHELEDTLVMNALALDGTCSGEHGVGIHKLEFVRSEYDATALTLMRAIKAGIDPKGIMNPGTLLPPLAGEVTTTGTATIDPDSLNGWIIRPESLEESTEPIPAPNPVVERKLIQEPWYAQVWTSFPRLFVRSHTTNSNGAGSGQEQEALKHLGQGEGL